MSKKRKRKNNREQLQKPPIATKGVKAFLFYLVQFTWGLPVNLIGFIVFLVCLMRSAPHEKFCNCFISYVKKKNFGGLSLGLFVFMSNKDDPKWRYNTRIHEYGHTIQCLLLGPLYWLVVALPSAVWCNFFASYRKKNDVSYYKLYCESWANSWGEKFSCMKRNEAPAKLRNK